MNNEEILQAVSEQKNKNDEFENIIQSRGAMLASGIGLIMAVIMVFAESSIFHKMDLGKPAIIFLIIFVSDLFEGIKFKSKKKLLVLSVI